MYGGRAPKGSYAIKYVCMYVCTKLVDIGKVSLALGERLCRALVELHAFKGM